MSSHTITIRTYLLSILPDGYSVDEDTGDWKHYNEIIEYGAMHFFEKMDLIHELPIYFKKEFLKRFYNREIGQETFASFMVQLESTLNVDCYNYLKFMDELHKMTSEELMNNVNMSSKGKSKGNNKALAVNQSRPETDLEISYSMADDSKILTYADMLQEQHAGQTGEQESTTTGYSGRNPYEQKLLYSQLTPVIQQVLHICENKCFYWVVS